MSFFALFTACIFVGMNDSDIKPIDIVYPLGDGSPWRNNEIRFSLRSLEKNLKGVGKIWVIGQKPSFLQNVNHIPYSDELVKNADGNIIRKILRACQEEELSEDFLLINDDHIILQPMIASEIPAYTKGDLKRFPQAFFKSTFWRSRLERTKDILIEKDLPTIDFDVHTPMVMNKQKAIEAYSQFDFDNDIGYTYKSLYGNVVLGEGPELNDEKQRIFKFHFYEDLAKRMKSAQFLAFNDNGLNPDLKILLVDLFPDKSIYENDEEEPLFEIVKWLKSDKDFEEGTQLYRKYGRSRKALRYFAKGKTNSRVMKLEHKIRELLTLL
jgi:hypothetical protein